ncbi:mevalonate kinase [Apilactobacillus timberlakei]|uniref:Mevalonate kinase n=1 Tax=Apilactobacillus timberlakei TaxID=2008380 RepID=A0ABY2YTF1_9LACO|nr:mevalonate kinase [Apilactobacillus timberlakei]TPR13953.1 mevalonate kinase [Apilactobacillus timberlakei]TPR15268.1 mevalonate kinase [Apilactobacillus timberlakei]TPR16799.1 mevalonate kinase [Apilactobacillus timberlakei]TPR17159.1 mevalonate kinase [Apilactobacillus timberlakei]TPR24063.1 mevalonate kinase [Apilactobacillus timberlakei]
MTKQAFGKSHAKIILMGEHSVVYNQPAIALPIPKIELKIKINEIDAGQLLNSKYYIGPIQSVPNDLLGIKNLVNTILTKINKTDESFEMTIDSEIPSERGMGSSAATSIAIIRALYNYFDTNISKEELLKLSDVEETITHGNPSGLDSATTGADNPVWFIRNNTLEEINFNLNATLVIADSGIKGRTDIAINYVKQQLINDNKRTQKSINKIGNLVTKARQDIEKNNPEELGILMSENQKELKNLKISNSKIDELVEIANINGSLGTKLTGSGLGGCIIALARNDNEAESIANALTKAGALDTWIQPFK